MWSNNAVVGDNGSGWNNLMIRNPGSAPEVVFYHWDGGAKSVATPITLGEWCILSQKNSGGLIRGRVNGGAVFAVAAGNQSGGATLDLGSSGFLGRIAAVIRLPNAPSEADERRLEGYVVHKCNLTSVLDASHPYKNSKP